MEKIYIHDQLYKRLSHFIQINQVPNILLHGPCGSGKRTIICDFINKLYRNKSKDLVMYVECGHGKGIKFIRDEVNYFAKTNCNGADFKSIVLLNADKLTIDAQSALRRSIELFCKTTRYFIILHDKNRLLNPLTSRFCELFVPLPIIDGEMVNLHMYVKDSRIINKHENQVLQVKKILSKFEKNNNNIENFLPFFELSEELYNKGISGIALISYMIKHKYPEDVILAANKLKTQIKCEKILIFSILNCMFLRSNQFINNVLSI